MGLFEHHPASTGALRSAGSDSFAAAKQLSSFADEVRGVSTAVPLAVEGTSLVDAARQPLRQVDRRALALVPVFRLQGKAAGLWADAVDDFDWRVDKLNDIWDKANPSAWQKTTDAFMGSPLLGLLGDHDEADAQRAELKRELIERHAQLEDQLDVIGDQIAKTLDAGPGPGVDAFYRFMTEAMSKAKAQRRAAEKKLATFGDDSWDERLKHSIGGGMIAAVMGMADAVVMATPFAPGTTNRYGVPAIPAKNMPSQWWDRTARELGLDTRGPAYNLAELSTIVAASLVPGGGPGKTIGEAVARAGARTRRPPVPIRTFTSDDQHVADLANTLEQALPGRIRGVNSDRVTGEGLMREVDIDLGDVIVQVKGKNARGLQAQIAETQESTGVTTVGFAPTIKHGARIDAARKGIAIFKDFDELMAYLKEFT